VDIFSPFLKEYTVFFLFFLIGLLILHFGLLFFDFFNRYSVLFECICGFSFLWCKNVTIELFHNVINILYVFNFDF